MKRRSFLFISSLGSIAFFIPFLSCNSKKSDLDRFPSIPHCLSELINDETISKLGSDYIKNHPSENTKQILKNFLLDGKNGRKLDSSSILNELNRKIKLDFETNNIIVLDGWILSKTEARLCALFSLS